MDASVSERRHERRRTRRRRTADEHGITAARVRPGYDVMVIDISADGALVETAYRLLPGRAVELQFELFARRVAVRGRVLRCAVAAVRPWAVVYRGAILFDCAIAWPCEADENGVPSAPCGSWGAATRDGV